MPLLCSLTGAALMAAVLVAPLAVGSASAQCADYGRVVEWTGGLPTHPFTAWDVAVAGSYAYVVTGSVLRVIDVTDPTSPWVAGSSSVGGTGVAVAGGYAYVADNYYDLEVADISDPAAPSRVGWLQDRQYGQDVAVAGGYAYVTELGPDPGLLVIDVTTPAAPTAVGFVSLPAYPNGVAVAGNYAYVANLYQGVKVVNISVPSMPFVEPLAGSTPGSAHGVAVAGDYAYVADYSEGLQVLDITNPRYAYVMGGVATPGVTYNVAVLGNYAYLEESGRLRVIDISNPSSPEIVGALDASFSIEGVAAQGSHVYVAARNDGLQIAPAQCDNTPPVAVAIASFEAAVAPGGIALEARFSSDLRVLGVNVYRAEGETPFVLQDQVSGSGEIFRYEDRSAEPGHIYRYQIGVVDGDGESLSQVITVSMPRLTYSLAQNTPNPFNPSTTIGFTLGESGHVTIAIFEVRGGHIRTLADGVYGAGPHEIQWDGTDAAGSAVGSGVYFYRLAAGNTHLTRRMVLAK